MKENKELQELFVLQSHNSEAKAISMKVTNSIFH